MRPKNQQKNISLSTRKSTEWNIGYHGAKEEYFLLASFFSLLRQSHDCVRVLGYRKNPTRSETTICSSPFFLLSLWSFHVLSESEIVRALFHYAAQLSVERSHHTFLKGSPAAGFTHPIIALLERINSTRWVPLSSYKLWGQIEARITTMHAFLALLVIIYYLSLIVT